MGEDENRPNPGATLVVLKLTKDQLKLIDECLSSALQPKGYEELIDSYALMVNIKNALARPEDAFGGMSSE